MDHCCSWNWRNSAALRSIHESYDVVLTAMEVAAIKNAELTTLKGVDSANLDKCAIRVAPILIETIVFGPTNSLIPACIDWLHCP